MSAEPVPHFDGATYEPERDPMFLTVAQLQELTGYVQPAAQVRWLQKNGLRHFVRADGHPRVPAAAVTDPPAGRLTKAVFSPDFDAVRVRN